MTDVYLTIASFVFFTGFCVFAWKKPGWGFSLMPVFVAAGIVLAAAKESVGVLALVILTVPVVTAIIRWAPQSSPLESPWYKSVAQILITIFLYLFVLALMILCFNYFGALLFILLIVGIVRFIYVRRHSLTLEVITTIGMSMRQSLPLPMALQTAAYGQTPKAARIFQNIAHWLIQGYPLSDALQRGYPKCPPDLLASIAAAEKMNQLPTAVETIRMDITEKLDEYKKIRPVHFWYPVFVLFFITVITLGLMYFIIPTFAEVLSDMSEGMAGLPPITQTLLNFSNWLKGRHGLNFLVLYAVLLWLIFYFIYVRFRRREPGQPRLLSRIGDFVKWHIPIYRWFEKNYSQLQLTEILRVGLRAGFPVNVAVRNAMGLNMNYCYRKRIQKWLGRIEEGDNIARSASRAGIGRSLAWALDDSVNKGNAPLILESLEQIYRSRYHYRLNLLNAIVCPLMVLGLGVCVGIVMLGMFLPMVKMIQVLV